MDGLAPSSHEDTVVRPPGRSVEQTLARAHLRLGSLALARVELETLAGQGTLDTDGLADLAEVRWRTGDLAAAGEAAGEVLVAQDAHPLALVIAAEAAAAVGRPGEARRLATRAIEVSTTSIDIIFAGMPRAGVWPADAAEPPPTAGTLFHRETAETAERVRVDNGGPPTAAPVGGPGAAVKSGASKESASGTTTHAAPMALGFWDGDVETDPATPDLPDPAGELEAGRLAYMEGAHEEASLRFGIALRLAPALAPAVLEVTDGARGASLTMVRGDAYRLVGHEAEAQRAYALAASGGLPERRRRPRIKPAAPPSDDAGQVAVDRADGTHDGEERPVEAGVEAGPEEVSHAVTAQPAAEEGSAVEPTVAEAEPTGNWEPTAEGEPTAEETEVEPTAAEAEPGAVTGHEEPGATDTGVSEDDATDTRAPDTTTGFHDPGDHEWDHTAGDDPTA